QLLHTQIAGLIPAGWRSDHQRRFPHDCGAENLARRGERLRRLHLPLAVDLACIVHAEFEDEAAFLLRRLTHFGFRAPAPRDLDAGLAAHAEIVRADVVLAVPRACADPA